MILWGDFHSSGWCKNGDRARTRSRLPFLQPSRASSTHSANRSTPSRYYGAAGAVMIVQPTRDRLTGAVIAHKVSPHSRVPLPKRPKGTRLSGTSSRPRPNPNRRREEWMMTSIKLLLNHSSIVVGVCGGPA